MPGKKSTHDGKKSFYRLRADLSQEGNDGTDLVGGFFHLLGDDRLLVEELLLVQLARDQLFDQLGLSGLVLAQDPSDRETNG